jgi:hypothetical protein
MKSSSILPLVRKAHGDNQWFVGHTSFVAPLVIVKSSNGLPLGSV